MVGARPLRCATLRRLAGPPPPSRAWPLWATATACQAPGLLPPWTPRQGETGTSSHGVAPQTVCGTAETPPPRRRAQARVMRRWAWSADPPPGTPPAPDDRRRPGVVRTRPTGTSRRTRQHAYARRRRRGRGPLGPHRPPHAPASTRDAPATRHGATSAFPHLPPATDLRRAEPNAALQAPPIAAARNERRLLGVGSTAMLGAGRVQCRRRSL